MGSQSFSASQFPAYQNAQKDSGDSHRPLVNQNINDKQNARYGSLSLDNRATSTMSDESSVLVTTGDPEYGPDAIHKMNGDHTDSDDGFFIYTWKEYLFSWRFVELILCVVPFTFLFLSFESEMRMPRIRPMPIQTILNEDGEATINAFVDEAGGWESAYSNIVWNPMNKEKYLGQTIGHREYQILMGLVPLLLQLGMVCLLQARRGKDLDAIHRTICLYFVGIGTTDTITNCVKYYVGYLRPIFLDVCEPYYDEDASKFRCANESWSATDARMSFPSNHSAWSFCGMMLLSMYLEQNFGLSSLKAEPAKGTKEFLRQRNRQALYRLISFLCYFPMLFAFFVAASRVVDNKHFPADVIGGAILGGSVASLVFGIWFPPQ